MVNILDTRIEFLKGVGPKRALVLNKEAGVFTFGDLLNYFPFRYIDKSRIFKVSDVNNDLTYFQLVGFISNLKSFGEPRTSRMSATFTDDSGSVELVWFKGFKWLKSKFLTDKKYLLFGKASPFNRRFSFVHPDIELYDEHDLTIGETLQGVYPTTESMKNQGLGTKQIAKLTKTLLVLIAEQIPEVLPELIIRNENLIKRSLAYQQIHWPSDPQGLKQAVYRLSFDEYFFFQLKILSGRKYREQHTKGFRFSKVGNLFHAFYRDHLPFALTEAQKRVVREIRHDLGSGIQMNRLLQGDVGSGKTIVALLVMLLALDNGFQTALMAPTEILANQHFVSISSMLKQLPIKIALLTGSTKSSERKLIDLSLREGSLQIIVGTHALIEDTVVFDALGLVIIDEQHRFGVAQRARLWEKSDEIPHVLSHDSNPHSTHPGHDAVWRSGCFGN
jgi:ATP-dependent DNA helicase RecG